MTKQTFFLFLTAALAAGAAWGQNPAGAPAVDSKLEALLAKWRIPGGAVAIVRDGEVVYARGFGELDPGTPMPADAQFRLASLSKPITATAVLRLVEDGRLALDERVFDRLPQYREALGDERMAGITVRQLLQHSGGWDKDVSGDPVFASWKELTALGASLPPDREEMILFWLGQKLDFDPGARHAYSNFGYVLLGRLIETVSGVPYEEFVRTQVLASARQGSSLRTARLPGEAVYFDREGAERVPSVFSEELEMVPEPYGGFSLALQDASGAWVASAPGLALFQYRVAEGKLLRPETVARIVERPAFASPAAEVWYGLGWNLVPVAGTHIWQHAGAFAGSVTEVVHIPGGMTYAALFNSMPADHEAFLAELEMTLVGQ